MCYNCGCKNPDDDMGRPQTAITEKTFQNAAADFEMSLEDTKKEVLKLLQSQLEKDEEHDDSE